MVMSRDQNVGRSHYSSFERVEQIKRKVTSSTNENSIQ